MNLSQHVRSVHQAHLVNRFLLIVKFVQLELSLMKQVKQIDVLSVHWEHIPIGKANRCVILVKLENFIFVLVDLCALIALLIPSPLKKEVTDRFIAFVHRELLVLL
jgi:hypothetical protein